MERTLAIIKPDAVSSGVIGEIIHRAEEEGFTIRALKLTKLTKAQAEAFYSVHKGKPFFERLTKFMASGPVVVMVLEGEDAIKRWREIIGSTDPQEAAEGTIRRKFGTNVTMNAVHGSDSKDTAEFEIKFFFSEMELLNGAGN